MVAIKPKLKLCQPSSAGATAGSTWNGHGRHSFDGASARLYAHAKYAFDLNSDSSWDGCCTGYPKQWIQIDRGSNPAKIFSYELSTDNGECPVDWGVYGSNSKSFSSSKLLDSVKGEKCHDKQLRTFDMDISNSYRYLRWRFTKGVGGNANGIRINDIKLQCSQGSTRQDIGYELFVVKHMHSHLCDLRREREIMAAAIANANA